MSIITKQRFGEVLAVVLIVGLVGLLVYFMIPTHAAAPKVSPVTVRSNTSFGLHNQSPTQTLQASPASTVSKATAVVAHNDAHDAGGGNVSAGYKGKSVKTGSEGTNISSATSINAQGSSCSAIIKPITSALAKVGSTLHLTAAATTDLSAAANCQS